MTRLTTLIILVSLLAGCTGSDAGVVPKIPVADTPRTPRHIVVSIDAQQQFYIGTQKVDSIHLDSLLNLEINKIRATVDTPTVVINADNAAWYGKVFQVMKAAKKNRARVVANVRQ
jgi:biopolymer transport protein ExbD